MSSAISALNRRMSYSCVNAYWLLPPFTTSILIVLAVVVSAVDECDPLPIR